MCGWREGKGGAHCAPSTSTTIDEAAAGVSDTTVSLSESELELSEDDSSLDSPASRGAWYMQQTV